MTREEASAILNHNVSACLHGTEWGEALDMAIKALEQEPCENAISRDDALKLIRDCGRCDDKSAYGTIYHGIEHLPSVQPKYNTDEWCHDCSEYNHEKHCCPRYNRVIRKAVEEIKEPKIKVGHWIPSHIPESILDECSECGFSCGAFTFNYCPMCGARMIEPQESEDKEWVRQM